MPAESIATMVYTTAEPNTMTSLQATLPPYPDSNGQLSSHPAQPKVQEPHVTVYVAPPPQLAISHAAQIGDRYRAEMYAQCAQGNHAWTKKYGVCGIITGVMLFPVGLICLFMDSHRQCTRCGEVKK
ncbi:putative uncharacterized conserved protein (DUF2367) [Lyophyllum shimeji]|uniref:Uncharacterized conserved protein (DUF2367) n=1 Tax=Lyophyllum shimeji TaxID=47721 RepID=A0A9P3PSZ9_LYOSH|nr:putative uncharacterized conserved protein (DUF2367) [Lyophyllum shimeji]